MGTGHQYGHPGYRYGIWDIDSVILNINMGYMISIWSSCISIWDGLSICLHHPTKADSMPRSLQKVVMT